ncbi:MAG: hypothetical protein U0Q15_00860 [Kineosporiaceae bacterium]
MRLGPGRGRRLRAGAAAAAGLTWLAVVATVSAISWTAIDSAGRQVGAGADGAGAGEGSPVTQVTAGGRAAVDCRSDGAHLRWASPASGWRVERKDVRTSGAVRVDFLTQGREIVVRASCGPAGPSFGVAEERPHDEDDEPRAGERQEG